MFERKRMTFAPRIAWTLLSAGLLACPGCEGASPGAPQPESKAQAANDPAANAPAATDPALNDPAATVRTPAGVGVGKKGSSLRNETGVGRIIAQPAVSLFAARERAVFEIQIPHAMQLYKALHGNDPKTHDEFMANIIKANRIKLPELPPGQKYVYDPKTSQLMVEGPAAQQ